MGFLLHFVFWCQNFHSVNVILENLLKCPQVKNAWTVFPAQACMTNPQAIPGFLHLGPGEEAGAKQAPGGRRGVPAPELEVNQKPRALPSSGGRPAPRPQLTLGTLLALPHHTKAVLPTTH